MNLHSSNTHYIPDRMPTVEEELFSELLQIGKKPICICGRYLQPIKKKYLSLYIEVYQVMHPRCRECGQSLSETGEEKKADDVKDQENISYANNDDTIWLCPSKQLYPHLFGYLLCKTCCVEQVLSCIT